MNGLPYFKIIVKLQSIIIIVEQIYIVYNHIQDSQHCHLLVWSSSFLYMMCFGPFGNCEFSDRRHRNLGGYLAFIGSTDLHTM